MRTNPTLGRGTACLLLGLALGARPAAAQFRDDFDGSAPIGWATLTGDGQASAEFTVAEGHGTLAIDATRDRDDIWWALIKRNVAPALDPRRLARPGAEVRVEAREIPSGGKLLCSGRKVKNQAFIYRSALGLQFHLELTEAILQDWSRDLRHSQREKILRETPQYLAESNHLCRLVAEDFTSH